MRVNLMIDFLVFGLDDKIFKPITLIVSYAALSVRA